MAWTVWGTAEELCKEHNLAFGVFYNPDLSKWQGIYQTNEEQPALKVRVFGNTPVKVAIAANQQLKALPRPKAKKTQALKNGSPHPGLRQVRE